MRGGVESYKDNLDPAQFASIVKKSRSDQRGLQKAVKGSIVGFMRDKLLKPNSQIKNTPIVEGIFAGIKAEDTGLAEFKRSPRQRAFVV